MIARVAAASAAALLLVACGGDSTGRYDAQVAEVREAVEAGAEALLLDNMDPPRLSEAVATARELAPSGRRPRLEASGGVALENVAEIAATGVDEISVGALTHSAPALDLGLVVVL